MTKRNEIFGKSDTNVVSPPSRDVMKEDFGFEVPVAAVPIPSQGKVYPVNSPLFNQETVDIRGMTAREEDIITSPALINKGSVITELIRSCLIDKSVSVDDMLVGDRNALMIAVRITGYGKDYQADVPCKACGERFEGAFDLSKLEIKRLTIDPVSPGENLFEYTLPVSGLVVKFKFITGRDETDLLQEQVRAKKVVKVATDSFITGRLQKSIVSVRDVTDRAKISHFIRHMPANDSFHLRKYMEENEPGIDMSSTVECTNCAEVQTVSVPFGVRFFWPDAGR